MNKLALIACATGLACAGFVHGQSFYKCVNPDGSVSYQDRACPETASEKKVSRASQPRNKRTDYAPKVFPLPGVGEGAVLVFDYMEHVVRENGDRSTTVGIRSKPGARHKMSMMMTFLPNPSGEIPSRQQQENVIRRIAVQQMGLGDFSSLKTKSFDAKSGAGWYASINDPSFPRGTAPDGEYATVTAGQIVDSNVVVEITILSDGVDNKGFRDALNIAETFVAAPGILAAAGGIDLNLPAPPAGFTWQRAPEIKGVFLKPEGWHFDTQIKGDTHAYFISREPNMPPDGFDTGLTINVNRDVPTKTGMMPSQFAAAYIDSGAAEFDVIGETFSSSRGTYIVHGGLFRMADAGEGEFNAHMVAMANDSTGTVYLIIFEGPAENWDATWQIGETMLRNIALNDSI